MLHPIAPLAKETPIFFISVLDHLLAMHSAIYSGGIYKVPYTEKYSAVEQVVTPVSNGIDGKPRLSFLCHTELDNALHYGQEWNKCVPQPKKLTAIQT